MRLINFGVGEIVDRLTILSLKILYGRKLAQATEHFEHERAALLSKILSRTTINGAWFEHAVTLGAVNGALWQEEDRLRTYRVGPPSPHDEPARIIECAYDIQALNDQRAGLIETINKLTGDHLGSEKV